MHSCIHVYYNLVMHSCIHTHHLIEFSIKLSHNFQFDKGYRVMKNQLKILYAVILVMRSLKG